MNSVLDVRHAQECIVGVHDVKVHHHVDSFGHLAALQLGLLDGDIRGKLEEASGGEIDDLEILLLQDFFDLI